MTKLKLFHVVEHILCSTNFRHILPFVNSMKSLIFDLMQMFTASFSSMAVLTACNVSQRIQPQYVAHQPQIGTNGK